MILTRLSLTLFVLLAPVATASAQRADTAAAVARGFALLETYRTSGDMEHASEAARSFSQAVKEDPKDALAHYGLAATLVNAKKTMTVVRQMGVADGEALLVAKRELEKALELDPKLLPAAELLVQIAEKTNDRKALQRAFEVLPEPPAKRDTVAEQLARTPTSATDFLRRATILFAKREDAAALDAYNKGLSVLDPAGLESYVADVLVTATPQEVISLTDGSLEKRAGALQLFWKKRSVRGGISASDRIAEHYHRLATARERYALPRAKGVHLPLTVFGRKRQGVEMELDDRGLIYVRYGEALNHIRGRGYVDPKDEHATKRTSAREAWVYRDADGRHRVYYFVGGRLEADIMRALSDPEIHPADRDMFLEDLARYDGRYAFINARFETIRNYQMMARLNPNDQRRYQQMIAERMEDARRQNDRIVERNRDVLFAAFAGDAAYPRFEKPLILYHDFATFRGRGCTDVVWSVAAPTPTYRLSVALADTFTWETQSVDTVVMKGNAVGTHLRSTGVFCTTPDYNAYVRFTAAVDSAMGVTAGGELRVPDYSGRGLLISDLLFGRDEDGPFVRGEARMAIVPPRQFRQGEPFRLFYEIYNLKAGDKYRTQLTFDVREANPVVRLFAGKKSVVLSFDGEATTDGLTQEIRTVAPEIEDGEVELTVKVTSLATGESVTAKEKIWILPARE